MNTVMTTPNKKTQFSHNMNVRIDDINFGNHLCHSKFTNLLHNTRMLFLKSHNLSELNCFGCGLVMLNLSIDYVSQCHFNDRLEVTMNIERTERATILLSYSVLNHTTNKLAARATTLMGFIDIDKNKLRKIPVEFFQLFGIVQ